MDYLTATEQRWEAIYSIWGALWFTDPARLLPLIHERLVPGGKLVFSHAPAVPGSYGVQGFYAAGFTGRQVWAYRWAYERRPLRAVPLLIDVLDRYDATHARELALYLSWLAVALADANEPEEAATTARRMLKLGADISSDRTAERARVVLDRLEGYRNVPAVREVLQSAR